jgi:hypothetical protein
VDYSEYDKERAAVLKINAQTIFSALDAAALNSVSVIFHGGGDSGDFEIEGNFPPGFLDFKVEIIELKRDWTPDFTFTPYTRVDATYSIRDAIEIVASNFIDEKYGNWYDGDIRTHGTVLFKNRCIDLHMTSYEPQEQSWSLEIENECD